MREFCSVAPLLLVFVLSCWLMVLGTLYCKTYKWAAFYFWFTMLFPVIAFLCLLYSRSNPQ